MYPFGTETGFGTQHCPTSVTCIPYIVIINIFQLLPRSLSQTTVAPKFLESQGAIAHFRTSEKLMRKGKGSSDCGDRRFNSINSGSVKIETRSVQ